MVLFSTVMYTPLSTGRFLSVDVTRHTRATMSVKTLAGSSTERSSAKAGNSGKSPASSVFSLNELFSQVMLTCRSTSSKFTGASGRVLQMFTSILQGMTVCPSSSTRAAMRWRIEMV